MPKHAIAGGALLAVLAGPAAAELTAEGVWADWQRVYAAIGNELTAESAEYDGTRLLLTGLTTTAESGEFTSVTRYGTIALVEQPDGSILIDLPSRMEMSFEMTGQGEDILQDFVFESEGLSSTIREVGGARVYDTDAARVSYIFADAEAEVPFEATVTMTGVDSTYTSLPQGDMLSFEQTLDAADAVLAVSAADPVEGGSLELVYRLDALESVLDGLLDLTVQPASDSLSEIGVTFEGGGGHAGGAMSLAVDSPDGPFRLESTSARGSTTFALTPEALSYSVTSTEAELEMRVAAFPLPITLSMAEVTSGLTLPAGVSDTPLPFAMTIGMQDLLLDETLWSLFDPTGQLPRDPATLLLDLSGTALMRADIFGDPEAMATLGGPPGELRTLDLTQLRLSAAGAELTGEGALEFPTPGPIPQPVGTLNLALDGGFGLLDRLVALGFVPQQQAAFVKGMSGMVAREVGEDELRSVIEFTEGGGITANGTPLR